MKITLFFSICFLSFMFFASQSYGFGIEPWPEDIERPPLLASLIMLLWAGALALFTVKDTFLLYSTGYQGSIFKILEGGIFMAMVLSFVSFAICGIFYINPKIPALVVLSSGFVFGLFSGRFGAMKH